MRKIFLDKRVAVNGRTSHINLHNFVDLNEHIAQLVAGSTSATLPFVFQNGITKDAFGTVELGGKLVKNTVIDGDSTYDLTIQDLDALSINGSGNFTINNGPIGKTFLTTEALALNTDHLIIDHSTLTTSTYERKLFTQTVGASQTVNVGSFTIVNKAIMQMIVTITGYSAGTQYSARISRTAYNNAGTMIFGTLEVAWDTSFGVSFTYDIVSSAANEGNLKLVNTTLSSGTFFIDIEYHYFTN